MPELGKYAAEVLSAYAVSALLLAALIGLSLWKSARVRRALAEAEERSRENGR